MRTIALLFFAASLACGCLNVYTTTTQYNGDKAVALALRTNAVPQAAYSRSLTTLTTTNGVASTEIAAGGGIVTSVSVNSSKRTDPQTTVPLSLTQ